MIRLNQYRKKNLVYRWDSKKNFFFHNLERDLHIFVIWERGIPYDQIIFNWINSKFIIIDIFDIKWSEEKVIENYSRLYRSNSKKTGSIAYKDRGNGPYKVVVVEDVSPVYLYYTTFSGKCELVNRNIVTVKESIRNSIGGNYIHSSNNVAEFFRDGVLLFGFSSFTSILLTNELYRNNSESKKLDRDLAGANGWDNLTDFFESLRFTTNYVILRNVEDLTNGMIENGKDVDLLVEDQKEFLILANSQLIASNVGSSWCKVKIGNFMVDFDATYVGDGYYDNRWQLHLLENSKYDNGIINLEIDDYFFTLLYHTKVHKQSVKDSHKDRLSEMALIIGFDKVHNIIFNDRIASEILEAYLVRKRFKLSKPLNKSLYLNKDFIKLIKVRRLYGDMIKKEMWNNLLVKTNFIPFMNPIMKKIEIIIKALRIVVNPGK